VLLLWEADEPDHVENIEGFAKHKLDALLAHRSQFRSTMRISGPAGAESEELAAFVARLDEHHARAGALGSLMVAEAFKALRDL
jgi:LmbE family N-acetylglucosaminyl deacetylase